jgi:hypothetical protein
MTSYNQFINPIDKFHNIGNFPVDAVVTFRGEIFNLNGNREGYNYEIKYCLRSISKYMPWIRRIYVLQGADAKVPSFFSKNYKRNGVFLFNDHEIIPKKYLPTTNSDSIETFLTLLPGLSEHFIYLCDDMFVMKPVSVDYFFTPNGVPRRIIFPRTYIEQVGIQKIKAPPSPGSWYAHIPIPYTKTEINEYLNKYPDFIEYIRSIRSRNDKIKAAEACHKIGLTFPCLQLHTNVDFMGKGTSNNEYELGISDYLRFPIDTWKIKDCSKKFLCIGDYFIGSLEERSVQRNILKESLESIFPEKSRAEK